MNNIVCYTAITNAKDSLKEQPKFEGVDYIAYLDFKPIETSWEVREIPTWHVDPRRNTRHCKLLSHILFPNYEYIIWIDGSIELLVDPHILIEKYLKDTDLATFLHPDRDNIYDEAEFCKLRGLDDRGTIDNQISRYKRLNVPNTQLAETKVVIRRNTKQITLFNSVWFSELFFDSKRDQISFPFSSWVTNTNVTFMQPMRHPGYNNGEFQYYKHSHYNL